MPFRFGFSDDVDSDDGKPEESIPPPHQPPSPTDDSETHRQLVPVKAHKLEDLLSTLPERICYSTVRIESPLGKVVHLPRRELFDVRAQLLQEDSAGSDHIIDQIERTDLREGVYEGGFKTWECSVDLAGLLLDRGPRKDIDELVRCDQVVELGAGSALPTLILFRHALLNDIHPLTFTLADYNEEVLRLITLPNLLLTWALNTPQSTTTTTTTSSPDLDLDLTPHLLTTFLHSLHSRALTLHLLSGPWSPPLTAHIPVPAPEMGLLVLAAETIYSPAATDAFADVLATLLRRARMAKALVAAKRVYFGVGGSVDGLKVACRERGAVAAEVENLGVVGMDVGVGRAVVEVQLF